MPNDQEITDPLSLNRYTYGYNNPVLHTDPSGHVAIPFIATVLLAGTVAGMLAAAVDSAFKKNFSIQKVVQGGAIGGMLALLLGAGAAYFGAGSALASTSAVGAGLGYGYASTLGSAGATGFEQARQLVQRNPVKDETVNKYAFGLTNLVDGFAKSIGAQHFMEHKVWQTEVWC